MLVAIACVLSGCGGGGANSFDPTDMLSFLDTKKPLPGVRHPVFPDGVPGVEQGVPKELYKGAQQNDLAATDPAAPAAAPPPAAAEAPPPKEKPKKRVRTAKRRSITAPPPDEAPAAPPPPPQQQPAAAPPQEQPLSPFPAPLPSGSFSH
jgi:hypothetical protein